MGRRSRTATGEIEGLIGFFVNTLVLRTEVSGELNFRGNCCGGCERVCAGSLRPPGCAVREAGGRVAAGAGLSRTPLFQVMFILQNMPQAELQLGDITLRPFNVDSQTAKFDLTLSFSEAGGELQGWLSYNAELFEPATVSRMIGHYCRLLQGIVEQPEQPLGELPMLTEGERQQVLVEWNNTAVECPHNLIHEMFERQAAKTPSIIAVECGGLRLAYSELNCRANQLACYLRKLGVGAEVRVGICMERSLEMVVGLLGILKAGGAYVPLDPNYPPERLSYMLEDSSSSVLLTEQKLLPRLPSFPVIY